MAVAPVTEPTLSSAAMTDDGEWEDAVYASPPLNLSLNLTQEDDGEDQRDDINEENNNADTLYDTPSITHSVDIQVSAPSAHSDGADDLASDEMSHSSFTAPTMILSGGSTQKRTETASDMECDGAAAVSAGAPLCSSQSTVYSVSSPPPLEADSDELDVTIQLSLGIQTIHNDDEDTADTHDGLQLANVATEYVSETVAVADEQNGTASTHLSSASTSNSASLTSFTFAVPAPPTPNRRTRAVSQHSQSPSQLLTVSQVYNHVESQVFDYVDAESPILTTALRTSSQQSARNATRSTLEFMTSTQHGDVPTRTEGDADASDDDEDTSILQCAQPDPHSLSPPATTRPVHVRSPFADISSFDVEAPSFRLPNDTITNTAAAQAARDKPSRILPNFTNRSSHHQIAADISSASEKTRDEPCRERVRRRVLIDDTSAQLDAPFNAVDEIVSASTDEEFSPPKRRRNHVKHERNSRLTRSNAVLIPPTTTPLNDENEQTDMQPPIRQRHSSDTNTTMRQSTLNRFLLPNSQPVPAATPNNATTHKQNPTSRQSASTSSPAQTFNDLTNGRTRNRHVTNDERWRRKKRRSEMDEFNNIIQDKTTQQIPTTNQQQYNTNITAITSVSSSTSSSVDVINLIDSQSLHSNHSQVFEYD